MSMCGPPTTHSFGTCLNLYSWASKGITQTEPSKWTFHKSLTAKKFQTKKNIGKKTVMNTIFHHSASITTKLTSQSHRLSQTGDYATSRWWPIEFPAKTFLSSISLSLFALFSHVVAEGKEEEENMREKEGEANPIMRDHHQNPMTTWVSPKGPTS